MQKVVPCVLKKQFLKKKRSIKIQITHHKSTVLNTAIFQNGKKMHGAAIEVCSDEYNRTNLNSVSCPSFIKPCHRLHINAQNKATF